MPERGHVDLNLSVQDVHWLLSELIALAPQDEAMKLIIELALRPKGSEETDTEQ